ncbi:MAG TPA: hypothetical protein VJ967_03220 [Clostridia bacterium]|nr:hypothetical protein [Clostridia bacterium]
MIPAWPHSKPAYTGRQQYKILFYAVLLGIANGTMGIINAHVLELPLFLDTIGTLLSTALWGFWPGAVTAVSTHLLQESLRGITGANLNLPWMICSLSSVITLALMIRFDLFKTFIHAVMATILITLANSISGALVATLFFSGITIHPVDYIMTAFLSVGQSFFSASFWARLPINLIDKGIAVFIVFGITELMRIKKKNHYRPNNS